MARQIELLSNAEIAEQLFGVKPTALAVDHRDPQVVALATADNKGYGGWLAVHGHDGNGRPCYFITAPDGVLFMQRPSFDLRYLPKGKANYVAVPASWKNVHKMCSAAIDVLLGKIAAVTADAPAETKAPVARADIGGVKLRKFYVEGNGKRARVWYWSTNRQGRPCVVICDKDYGHDLAAVFRGVDGVTYKNETDSQTDYFDKGEVAIFEDHPMYLVARALVR